jgi:hypothetical protein
MPEEIVADGVAPADVAPAPAAPAAPAAVSAEKTMMIPTSAMKRVKEEEYSKGRQAALDQLAKDAGYESNADLVSALARLKQAPPAAAPRPQAPQAAPAQDEVTDEVAQAQASAVASRSQNRQEAALQRNLEKALNERNKYANSASDYRKQLDAAHAEVDAIRAEMHLRTIAAGVGVQDVDYSIMLLTREVEKLTPEQAAQFDERAFFEGLRKTKPLLFGEQVVPATTGVGGGSPPKPPAPGQVTAAAASNGRVDAKKMNPQEYQALLRSRGIMAG